MSKKKVWIIVLCIGIFLLLVGFSYAYWGLTFTQKEENIATTNCFKLEFTEGNSIFLQNAYPMSEEEGFKQAPYTFTIQNICSTTAFYQVNLEDIETELKALSNQYIKVSLNRSKGKVLSTYEEVSPTIDNAISSHKLTSGSLKEGESKYFQVWLWMDENTPAIGEVMNATFLSKVTVVTVYKEDVTNTIALEYQSLNTTYSHNEIIKFIGKSDDYKIIEYSEDNVIWNPVESPSKEVTIIKNYETYGTYTMYFKDEMGNVNYIDVVTTMIDVEGPTITLKNEPAGWSNDTITIYIEASDDKIGLHEVAYSFDGGLTFQKDNFKSYTENASDIQIVVRDQLGNVSNVLTDITKIDKENPTAKISVSLKQNVITIKDNGSSDSQSSIVKREYKLDNGSYIIGGTSYQFQTGSGVHNVYLKVTDEAGNFSETMTSVTVLSDVLIYNLGTSYYSYDNRVFGNGCQTASFTSNSISFPACGNKIVTFQKNFANQYRYLKVIAKMNKNASFGSYYVASFGVGKSLTFNDMASFMSGVILKNMIIDYSNSSKLLDYNNFTTFTLDLYNVDISYYVFLYGCDTIYTIQKVWLTNNI